MVFSTAGLTDKTMVREKLKTQCQYADIYALHHTDTETHTHDLV